MKEGKDGGAGGNRAMLVYVTVPDENQAMKLARLLVEKEFAAGVNVLPGARSVYRWQGEICEASECVLMVQTSAETIADLTVFLAGQHSHEVPCIVAMQIADGYKPFLQWINTNSGLHKHGLAR